MSELTMYQMLELIPWIMLGVGITMILTFIYYFFIKKEAKKE